MGLAPLGALSRQINGPTGPMDGRAACCRWLCCVHRVMRIDQGPPVARAGKSVPSNHGPMKRRSLARRPRADCPRVRRCQPHWGRWKAQEPARAWLEKKQPAWRADGLLGLPHRSERVLVKRRKARPRAPTHRRCDRPRPHPESLAALEAGQSDLRSRSCRWNRCSQSKPAARSRRAFDGMKGRALRVGS